MKIYSVLPGLHVSVNASAPFSVIFEKFVQMRK